MATIIHEISIDRPPAEVWTAVADVAAVNRLIDFLGEVRVDGASRSCELGDAGTLHELIVTVDAGRQRLAYSIQSSPFGFDHHHSSMQVEAEGSGSRLTWITDVAPDTLAGVASEPLEAAVDSIKRHFS